MDDQIEAVSERVVAEVCEICEMVVGVRERGQPGPAVDIVGDRAERPAPGNDETDRVADERAEGTKSNWLREAGSFECVENACAAAEKGRLELGGQRDADQIRVATAQSVELADCGTDKLIPLAFVG